MNRKGTAVMTGLAAVLLVLWAAHQSLWTGSIHWSAMAWAAPFVLGGALGLGWKYDQTRLASLKDVLTGAFNRRLIHELYPRMVAQMDRQNKKLSVTVLDVNDFKGINDAWGHEAGDEVLRSIAELLEKRTRFGDVVVRWGGDEFVIIAPFTESGYMGAFNERIQSEIKELSAATGKPVSVSMGTAVYPDHGSALEELIRLADQMMYEGKEGKVERGGYANLVRGSGAAGG